MGFIGFPLRDSNFFLASALASLLTIPQATIIASLLANLLARLLASLLASLLAVL